MKSEDTEVLGQLNPDIKYKTAVLTHKVLAMSTPAYLSNLTI